MCAVSRRASTSFAAIIVCAVVWRAFDAQSICLYVFYCMCWLSFHLNWEWAIHCASGRSIVMRTKYRNNDVWLIRLAGFFYSVLSSFRRYNRSSSLYVPVIQFLITFSFRNVFALETTWSKEMFHRPFESTMRSSMCPHCTRTMY